MNSLDGITIGTPLTVLDTPLNRNNPRIARYIGQTFPCNTLDTKYGFVGVNGGPGNGWLPIRFEISNPVNLSTPAPNKAPAKTGPARNDKGQFKGTVKNTPVVLRPGSLYKVKRKNGVQVARLRKVIKGDVLALSRHGKFFIGRKSKLELANKDEVNQYLKEAHANE